MNRLATIFSIGTTAGVLLATVSGVVWIIAVLRHRETVAKALCIAGITVAVAGFILFLWSYDSSLHREQKPEAPITQAAAPVQPQEPVSVPSGDYEGIAPAELQEPTEDPQEPVQPAEPTNPLSALTVQEHPVMNGIKTERIGTWASITTTKEFFSNATDEQVFQYLNEVAENEYNWINVFFEDGTGLYCIGSVGGFSLEYGSIDKNEGGPPPLFEGRMFMFSSESKIFQEQGKKVDEAALNEALAAKIPQSYQASKWFQAYALATGTTDNSTSVTIQVDQGSDNQENAQALATQFYGTVKDVVESAGCQLESLDVTVVNNGNPVGLYFTEDGKSYTLLRNGKRTEFEIP